MIGKKIGAWLITEEIGDGGHAFVFKGMRGDDVAAVKMLKPSACEENIRKRFELEAETLQTLRHPNIVGFRDYIEQDGFHFLIIEYMDAGGIDNLLDAGPIAPDVALPIFDQILQGIAHAHSFGFIHRDIKPNNVLLNRHGEAKIADFGVAKALGAGASLTKRGFVLGTSVYMAPEYLTSAECDEKTDIYALGVTLYEMLTKRRPFDFLSDDEQLVTFVSRVMKDPIVPPSMYAPICAGELDRIVLKALDRDKKRRYRSVMQLHDDLAAAFPDSVGRPLRIRGGKAEALLPDGSTVPTRLDMPVRPLAPPRFHWVTLREAKMALGGLVLGALGVFVTGARDAMAVALVVGMAAAAALASIWQRHGARFELMRVTTRRIATSGPIEVQMPVTAAPNGGIPFYSGFTRKSDRSTGADSEIGAFLVVSNGPEAGRRFGLRPISRIGRDARFDVCPEDPEMSRQHAVLTFDGVGVSVRDLGSSNGTHVNEVRVTESVRLRHGDILRTGRTSFTFETDKRK